MILGNFPLRAGISLLFDSDTQEKREGGGGGGTRTVGHSGLLLTGKFEDQVWGLM